MVESAEANKDSQVSTFSRIMRPSDGVCWITGASGGIGRATAVRLADDGWTVYATARNPERLDDLQAQVSGRGKVIPASGDVTDPKAMAEIVSRITETSPLALALLNAGIYTPMRAENFRADTAREMFTVNLGGVANGLEPVLRYMIARHDGHIALTASVAGYRGLPDAAASSATKAGLIARAEALARDLVDLGVRISVINPVFVKTDASAVIELDMPFLMQPEQAAERIVLGLKRPGFEIAFPRRFAFLLRAVGMLPNQAYIATMRWMTGWGKRSNRAET